MTDLLLVAVLLLQIVTLISRWSIRNEEVELLRKALLASNVAAAAAESSRVNRKESVMAKDAVVEKVEEKAKELTISIPQRTTRQVMDEIKKSGESGTMTPDGKPL